MFENSLSSPNARVLYRIFLGSFDTVKYIYTQCILHWFIVIVILIFTICVCTSSTINRNSSFFPTVRQEEEFGLLSDKFGT